MMGWNAASHSIRASRPVQALDGGAESLYDQAGFNGNSSLSGEVAVRVLPNLYVGQSVAYVGITAGSRQPHRKAIVILEVRFVKLSGYR